MLLIDMSKAVQVLNNLAVTKKTDIEYLVNETSFINVLNSIFEQRDYKIDVKKYNGFLKFEKVQKSSKRTYPLRSKKQGKVE